MLGAYILDAQDFKKHRKVLLEAGVEHLFFGFSTPIEDLRAAGEEFRVYLEFQPFATHAPEHFVENLRGERRNLSLGCPSNPRLRRTNLETLREKLRKVEVEGVVLDFVRFPSFAAGDFYYSCFCRECAKHARSLGYDLKAIKGSVEEFRESLKAGKIRFSLLSSWLDFKGDVITRYMEEFSSAVTLESRAFLFPPSLSSFVGQDYERLSRILDVIHPMVYPEGALGPACLGYELHSLLSGVGGGPLQELYALLALEFKNNPRSLESLRSKGLPLEVIRAEVERAIRLSKTEVQPIITTLNITPGETHRRVKLALEAGAKVVHLFGFSSETAGNFPALKEL